MAELDEPAMLGTAELLADILERYGQPAVRPASCPICADLQASLAHRFCLLLADLGRTGLEAAPPGWRPCLPHLRAVANLRLERLLTQWVAAREERELAQALAAARRYVRTRQHRYRAEATGAEADELRAALAALLGAHGEWEGPR